MGCFDSTCAASNIVIGYDDPIVAFVITANKDHYAFEEAHLVYPWDKYSIVSFPIYGKYDDYGGIELDEKENALALSMLQKLFPNSELLDNDSLNHDFLRGPQTAYDKKEYHLGLIMIHRKVYDNLMASYKHIDGYEARLQHMISDITSKNPYDLNHYMKTVEDYIDSDGENKSKKEDSEKYMISWMKRDELRKAFRFGADHSLIRQYGKDADADYDDPNVLAPLTLCGSRDAAVHSLVTFWYIRHGVDNFDMTEEFHAQFHAFAEINALGEAFFDLGRTITPTLYRGQTTELQPAITFEYDNLLYLLNSEAHKAYDYRGGEKDIDKLVADLDTFFDKALSNLIEWKKKCEKGIDRD